MRTLLIAGISFYLLISNASGQKTDTSSLSRSFDSSSPDLETQLVSLENIISVALKNSPYLKHDSAMVEATALDVKLEKRRWHDNLSGFANYSTGNQRFLVSSPSFERQNNLLNGYRFGVNLDLPLSDFTSRRPRIQQAKAELDAAVHKREQTELEVRRQITHEYNNLIAAQRILKIKSSARENARMLQQLAEKQFREGSTSLEDYANVSDMTVRAEADFELARSNFHSLYLQFEDLVGVQLTSLMKKK